MGIYTMMVKEAIEYEPTMGLDRYPIFDEEYRAKLNQKILDNYWTREIGMETVSLFVAKMRNRMNLIMPKYNAIYLAQAKEIDPFVTARMTSHMVNEATQKNSDKSTSTGEQDQDTASKARAINSDFPQMQLSEYKDYATSGADTVSSSEAKSLSKGTGESESTGDTSGTMDSVSEGFSGGSMADLLANYADAFINTDLLVVQDLENLFMGIWNNDEHIVSGDRWNGFRGGWWY